MSVLLGNGHLFAEGLRSDLYFDKKKGSYWEKDLDPHWIVLGRSILRIYSKSIYRSSDDIGVPAKASGRSDTFCRRRNKTAWQISSVALGNCEEWFHEAARKSNKNVYCTCTNIFFDFQSNPTIKRVSSCRNFWSQFSPYSDTSLHCLPVFYDMSGIAINYLLLLYCEFSMY